MEKSNDYRANAAKLDDQQLEAPCWRVRVELVVKPHRFMRRGGKFSRIKPPRMLEPVLSVFR